VREWFKANGNKSILNRRLQSVQIASARLCQQKERARILELPAHRPHQGVANSFASPPRADYQTGKFGHSIITARRTAAPDRSKTADHLLSTLSRKPSEVAIP
jgi:hypothetical protein